ncbi:hypothetical protein BU183_19320, partial [Enterococcus faecium]
LGPPSDLHLRRRRQRQMLIRDILSTITNLSAISRLFQVLLPFSFNFLDQTVNLLVGFLLLGLARALSVKVKKAFLPTIALLSFGILNT